MNEVHDTDLDTTRDPTNTLPTDESEHYGEKTIMQP
jgi:hypothetical protein